MTYFIIVKDTAQKLEEEVTTMLADGWSLAGGVSVAATSYLSDRDNETILDYTYAQALTKQESRT